MSKRLKNNNVLSTSIDTDDINNSSLSNHNDSVNNDATASDSHADNTLNNTNHNNNVDTYDNNNNTTAHIINDTVLTLAYQLADIAKILKRESTLTTDNNSNNIRKRNDNITTDNNQQQTIDNILYNYHRVRNIVLQLINMSQDIDIFNNNRLIYQLQQSNVDKNIKNTVYNDIINNLPNQLVDIIQLQCDVNKRIQYNHTLPSGHYGDKLGIKQNNGVDDNDQTTINNHNDSIVKLHVGKHKRSQSSSNNNISSSNNSNNRRSSRRRTSR